MPRQRDSTSSKSTRRRPAIDAESSALSLGPELAVSTDPGQEEDVEGEHLEEAEPHEHTDHGISVVKKILHELKGLAANVILRNAAAMYGTTVVTSIFGFIFWFAAARLLPATSVGIAVAVISAMQFISLLCVFGLGTLAIGELAKDKSQARSMMMTASFAGGYIAFIVTILVGTILSFYSKTLHPGLDDPLHLVVFCLLSSLTTATVVVDDSCIGLLRGELQLRRNAVFAGAKLAILPLLVWAWSDRTGIQLEVAWILGIVISCATVAKRIADATKGQRTTFDFKDLFSKRSLILQHHWLNVSLMATLFIWPFIVATLIGTRQAAAFNAAWLSLSFVNIIPYHLSAVLFSLTPGDEHALQKQVRVSMRLCLILSAASAPFFAIFSYFILGIFSVEYRIATISMIILGLVTFPNAVKVHYVAICRVRGKMSTAAVRTTASTTMEIAFACVGALNDGLTGLALGLLVASLIELAIYSGPVLRVLRADLGDDPLAQTAIPDKGLLPGDAAGS